MADVFVVMGQSGEYSDHRDWPVCGYDSEKVAEDHAFEATKRAKEWKDAECEHGLEMRHYCDACHRLGSEDELRAWMGALDPEALRMDYTGSDYYVLRVPMRDALPVAPGAKEPR